MRSVAVVGAGPAGLMAAQTLAEAAQGKLRIDIYEAMPSAGRKFLLAGRGGLNLSHAEGAERFKTRYFERSAHVAPWLEVFGPQQVLTWAQSLGIETFVGSSQRVFPKEMKASPLLRAWLRRLDELGVRLHTRHRWLGWTESGALRLATPDAETRVEVEATVLALGGASWARLGSDGAWVQPLRAAGLAVRDLEPANCGFDVAKPWSGLLREKFAGQPLKSVALRLGAFHRPGEFVLTDTGVEGSLIYAASAAIRQAIAREGSATVLVDLLPALDAARVAREVAHPRGSKSLSAHLKSRLNLGGVKTALLHEVLSKGALHDAPALAASIKCLPLTLATPRPIDEAISSAGGVALEALSPALAWRERPEVFFAGEMLDWEAPTGGYLLTACLASGVVAARGVLQKLNF